jgi:flavin reductase (DIM6/NTAB) family NADH-FMN oxidoreductase RutF
MDMKAFFKLTCGLYILSTTHEGKDAACVINTLLQVTSTPQQLLAAVHKENHTCEVIEKAGIFGATVLTTQTDMNLLRYFGFRSSRDVDKFAGRAFARDGLGLPYLTEHMAARFSCKVTGTMDVGTHMLFIGEVVEAEVLSDEEMMTYAYYHEVKNGITPPKASSYQEKPKAAN